uniref:Integrase, catalytic region, zinc finger, CCHC-type, peptidase aspartic, catalytic n=1 Tax=Tanacetum cinerariifolium TaxID=118510 RepID=A0A6L2KA12_TANCI|nr:integrase, catalytic region, zinc finger, CCHC-type, peptidase aspartic, catalytic [Tanacetum cinerariifolium]
MLDRTDFASWQQHIRLYCRGKENGVNILKSIVEGPFQMGTVREPLSQGNKGAPHLGPERPRVYSDLSPKEKDRYNANIRATNILLQGLPKDIYTLINHYNDAKDIWDNAKMLLEGSELTKEGRGSQLYDDFEHFRQHKGETIHDYYVRFAKLINDMRNIKMTMSRMQLNSKFMNNMLPEWDRFVTAVKLNRGLKDSNYDQLYAYLKQHEVHANENKIVGNANPGQARHVKCYNCNSIGYTTRNCTQPKHPQNFDYFKDKMLLMQAQENRVALDEEKLLFLAGGQANAIDEDVDEQPVQDLALNVDNVFQADDCDAFDYDVDEAPTVQTMFMVNLSYADPVYDEAGPSYDSDILSEDNAMQGVQSNVSFVPNDAYMMIYNDMYEPHAECVLKTSRNTVVDNSLTTELATYKEQVELYERRPDNHVPTIVYNIEDTLEIAEITRRKMNDKMKDPECVNHKVKILPHDYLKENFLATFTPQKQLTPEQIFWSQDLIKMKTKALKEQTTASRPIKALMVYLPNTPATLIPREHFEGIHKALTREIKEMKDVFKKLEDEVAQNIIDRKHDEIERKNLLIANDNLIAYCLSKEVFPIATDSELNVARFTEMHVAHTIVEACYLELEAELSNLCGKSHINNHNELVNQFSNLETHSEADRTLNFRALDSQITQLTKKVIVLQAQNDLFRAENKKIKQHYKEMYDSIKITRVKHIEQVTNLTTENVNLKGQIQNAMNSVSKDHVKPTVFAPGVNHCTDASGSQPKSNTKKYRISPAKVKQVWKPKQVRQVWKPIGKVLASIGHQWRPTGRIFTLGEQCPLIRFTTPKVVSAKQNKKHAITCANQQEPNQNWGSNFLNSPSLSGFKCSCTDRPLVFGLRLLKTYDEDRSQLMNFMKKFTGTVRFRNDHFGAIMGYGDYVIGDSVISRVYYVEGLGHYLFSVRQFCNSDLEVAFRKHSCYVRDTDGVELIKGSRESNLYTILVEDMMKSSPICLLSKASKNKSWLWHRCLNHLNFDTINDLARKDLVRGLPRLKFEKDHLCSAEDLGKLQPTADIGIFVGYAPSRKGYRIYNKRTRRIMETNHVQFDELTEPMAHVHLSIRLAPIFLTPRQISSGLVPNPFPAAPYVPPTNKDLEILFQPMFDEYLEPHRVERLVSPAPTVQVLANSASTPSSTTIDQDAPSISISPSSSALQSPRYIKTLQLDLLSWKKIPLLPLTIILS